MSRRANYNNYHQGASPAPHAQYGAAPGGFSRPQPSGPPPGANPLLWEWFNAVDEDKSGAISLQELQRALVNGNWTTFDLDTCKLLMSLFDTDRTGTISFQEFAGLWKYIEDWQNVFRHFDQDRSGSIDLQELGGALQGFGYNLSPGLMSLIMNKYSSAPAVARGPALGITFDRFVRACVAIKALTESFQRADKDHDGWIQINYEQFLDLYLRSP